MRVHAGQIQSLQHTNEGCNIKAINAGEAESQRLYNDLYTCIDNKGEIPTTPEPETESATDEAVTDEEDSLPIEEDPEEDLSGM